MRVALLPFVLLATAAHGLRFDHPLDQQPLGAQAAHGADGPRSFVLWSDELGLANKNLMSPHVGHTVYPPPNATKLVKPVLKTLKVDNLRKNLWTFTNFLTRRESECHSCSYRY